MATVDKNFRIKNGLVVEGSTGTINGNTILTESAGDSYILNLVGGATLVKSVNGTYFSVDLVGNLNFQYSDFKSALTTDGFALTSDITDAISTLSGQTGTDISDAISTAETYTDTALESYTPTSSLDSTVGGYGYLKSADISSYATQSYADSAASTAQSNAENYADGLASNYDPAGAAATAESNANDYTDTAITNLVDGAPTLLDTLKELAQAIDNDASYASTLTTALGGKQDNLTAGNGIEIDGTTISVAFDAGNGLAINGTNLTIDTNVIATKTYADTAADAAESNAKSYADGLASNYDAAGAAATAQGNAEDYADTVAGTAESNAKSYADGLASNYDPAGAASTAESNANSYTDGYVGSVLSGGEAFTEINLNSVTSQRAVQTTLSSIATGSSVMSWAKSDYPTAKLWVKFATATNSQISEVLLTADSSNNIAITEFGIVGTNGNMGSVTATYLSGNIAVEVDTVYANTTVTVSATLIK